MKQTWIMVGGACAMLTGFEIDLEAIEADPGATNHLSVTPGLELILGG